MKQNKLKKYFCVILAVLMLIPLAACKDPSPSDFGETEGKHNPEVLLFYEKKYPVEGGFWCPVDVIECEGQKVHQGLYPEIACALSGEKYEYDIYNVDLMLYYGMSFPNEQSWNMERYPESYYAQLELTSIDGAIYPEKYTNKNPYILKTIPSDIFMNSSVTGEYKEVNCTYTTRLNFGYSESVTIPREFLKEFNTNGDDCKFVVYLSVYSALSGKDIQVMRTSVVFKFKREMNKIIFSPEVFSTNFGYIATVAI